MNIEKTSLKLSNESTEKNSRVWYKGCALAFQARDTSSSLVARSKFNAFVV